MTYSHFNPEIRRERKWIRTAFALSIILHLLLILLIAWVIRHRPPLLPLESTLEEVEPPSLEIVFTESEPPQPAKPIKPSYVETVESQRQAEAPIDAPFESDKNTHAASEAPPSGDLPLPSQEGRESKVIEWEDRRHSEGEITKEDAMEGQPVVSQNVPAPPTPEEPVQEEKKEVVEPAPTPLNTPPPPSPVALALLDPATQPSARATNPTHRILTPSPQQPARPARPGYQPETQTTRIRGGLTNRGRAAVSARDTPLGRYKKLLSDAIGSRWYYYVNRQIDLISIGTIEIRFIVDRDGHAKSARVLSNTSNESFASVSLRSILEANIPPIPDDVAENLQAEQLEVDYTFTILSN